jgi:hypothetical protein
LELFDGQISLDDIINQELPLLNELVKAKEKLIKEQEKKRLEKEMIKEIKKG